MNIFVNGEEINYMDETINYETVCKLAGYEVKYRPSTTYHCRMGGDLERNGILTESKGDIKVDEGMSFTCMVTNNA